jgi:hypothetical protein
MFEHKETVGHKAALKLFAEAKEKLFPMFVLRPWPMNRK